MRNALILSPDCDTDMTLRLFLSRLGHCAQLSALVQLQGLYSPQQIGNTLSSITQKDQPR